MKVITYILGDNDFGNDMRDAAKYLVDTYGAEVIYNWSDELFLNTIASIMAGTCVARHFVRSKTTLSSDLIDMFNYFRDGWISRTEEEANRDHNYSSVSISVYDEYIWMH